jgi:predicted DCC family thiol-disulfide oxidoreductase YuxK
VHTVDLVFDGRCGFCTRAVLMIRRLDRGDRVRLHAFQQVGVLERFALTEDQARSAAWAVRDGRTTQGAAAVAVALDAATGVPVWSAARRLPGVAWAQDRLYRWVADHRYRLRGAVPWCEATPGACSDDLGGASCGLGPGSACRI